MKGKIFPDSSNIYQDQAKILFNYYKQAAETIVAEEERIEKEIANLEENKQVLEQEAGGLWKWFLTIILFFVYFIKKNEIQKKIDNIDIRINEFKKQHKEIFRDYKVTKLGIAYVPVAEQIKYEDKSFIVDYTGNVTDSEISLQLSRQNDLLIDTINKLDQLATEAPIVEKSDEIEAIETDDYSTSLQELNQYDYLGHLERSLRTISFCMEDLDTTSVTLPLVAEHSNYMNFLNDHATKEKPEDAPVMEIFDKDRYVSGIEKFQELNKLKDSLSTETKQFEDVLKSLMTTMAYSVQSISALKVASVDKVVLESNKVLFNILKSPYNHYSPQLEHEEIERIRNEKFDYSEDIQGYEPFNLKQSSRVRFNLITGLWTSEDGNTTNMPFGVHQIYEEIVAPMVQNLMAETRIERLKIYNHIKDQKISYLNKWHQDTDAFYRANRAESADIINLMQESLREYVAAYNTLVSLQRTEDSMVQSNGALESTVVNVVDNSAESLAAFEHQSKEFQDTQSNFEEYMERLKEDIDLKAEKFGHIEYYDAKLRDGYSNEVAVAAGEIHSLDDRRKSLANVNPLFAKKSDLPPQPNVEDITFEHISLNLPIIAKNALDELNKTASETDKNSTLLADPDFVNEYGISEENVDEDTPAVSEDGEDIENNFSEENEDVEQNELLEDLEDKGQEEEEHEEEDDEEEYEEDNEEGYGEEEDGEEEDGEEEEDFAERLAQISDEELQSILNELDIPYDSQDFDREKAIEEIISNLQNEEE